MKTIDQMMKEDDIPVVIADHEGYITHVNERFEGVFGWRAKEILGQPLTIIIPKHLHDSHHLGFSRFLTTEKATLLQKPLKLNAVAKDGREFEAEHLIIAERRKGRWVFGGMIRPL